MTVDPHSCEPNRGLQSLAQGIVLRVMALGQRFRLVVRRAIAGEGPGGGGFWGSCGLGQWGSGLGWWCAGL